MEFLLKVTLQYASNRRQKKLPKNVEYEEYSKMECPQKLSHDANVRAKLHINLGCNLIINFKYRL